MPSTNTSTFTSAGQHPLALAISNIFESKNTVVETTYDSMGNFQSVIERDAEGNYDLEKTENRLISSTLNGVKKHAMITIQYALPDMPPIDELLHAKMEDEGKYVMDLSEQDACAVCSLVFPRYTYYPCGCKCICAGCLIVAQRGYLANAITCPACNHTPVDAIN